MLKVENLSISFKGMSGISNALKAVNFSIKKGESLALVGESGSGKSVSALAIMRLLAKNAVIEQGKIFFCDKNIISLSEKEMQILRGKKISMIFQEPMTSLNPVMRCGKQVLEVFPKGEFSKKQAKEKVIELFKKVKLPRPESIFKSYPHQISGGQKQRVMIAMAIANNPELLIADEPTTALDVRVQRELLKLLAELKQEFGMSLLFISHDLEIVAELVDKVAVMYKGEVVETGLVEQIFKHAKHKYTKALLACRPPTDSKPDRLKTLDEFMNDEIEVKIIPSQINDNIKDEELILKVQNLNKKFIAKRDYLGRPKQWVKAVDEVSFQVRLGETLGLVGESGCGKTTLSRALLKLIDADSGRIFYDDNDILKFRKKQNKHFRRELNIVFQDPYSSLNPRQSVGNAIEEPLKVHFPEIKSSQGRKKVIELLEKTGLKESDYYKYPHEFSGGQRQRIVIARALALQPRFLICDESVSALDVSVQAMVLNLLNDLKREFGFTYIFISHDMKVVKYMSDRIMVMKDGKIIETADAEELYHNPKTQYTKELLGAIPNKLNSI